jgi:hypothetical protein
MSTEAERWAARQRGLSPAQERILRALAQFHTMERGCFPSQLRLSERTGISPSSLNTNLAILERHGLINREVRRKPSGTQATTQYHLVFDVQIDIPPKRTRRKPTPKTGVSRLQKSDTSQYPDSEIILPGEIAKNGLPDADTIARWLIAQAGPGLCAVGRSVIRTTDYVIDSWLYLGFNLELDVLPVVKARTQKQHRLLPIITWAYFTPAIREVYEGRTGIKPGSHGWRHVGPGTQFNSGSAAQLPKVYLDPLPRSRSQNALVQAAREDVARSVSWPKDGGADD